MRERSLTYICEYSDCFADDGEGSGTWHNVVGGEEDTGDGDESFRREDRRDGFYPRDRNCTDDPYYAYEERRDY